MNTSHALGAAVVSTEQPRLFCVHNETVLHAVELDATSHEDAVARYRQQYQTLGYACIRTSDAEVFFGLRPGQLHQVHHSDERTYPLAAVAA